ncbi:MAG: hypothetical protein OEV92_06120 [Nitrospinota bacterium]|nr:hypothetical protein [Nitrospinota bacterium]
MKSISLKFSAAPVFGQDLRGLWLGTEVDFSSSYNHSESDRWDATLVFSSFEANLSAPEVEIGGTRRNLCPALYPAALSPDEAFSALSGSGAWAGQGMQGSILAGAQCSAGFE